MVMMNALHAETTLYKLQMPKLHKHEINNISIHMNSWSMHTSLELRCQCRFTMLSQHQPEVTPAA